jgi:hypothetical protein
MIILTGCDSNTEWQLPWFVDNFKRMCAGTGCKLAVADFGMTKDMREYADFSVDWTIDFQGDGGWFNKVKLFNFTHTMFGVETKILWMDTDCEIRRWSIDLGQRMVHLGVRRVPVVRGTIPESSDT